MLPAFHGLIPERGIKRFGVQGGVQLEVCETTAPGDTFYLLDECRANTHASSFGHHVARTQFGVVNDQRTEPYRLAVEFGYQANLVVRIL